MILTNFTAGYSALPIQVGLSKKKMELEYGSEEDWYAACARAIATYYNPVSQFTDDSIYGRGQSFDWFADTLGEAEQIIENFLFYQGDQPIKEYWYFNQDTSTPELYQQPGTSGVVTLPTPWIKGQKVFQLLSYMKGVFAGRLSAARLSVENRSQKAQTIKTDLLNRATLRYQFKEIFDTLQSEEGVEFNPFPSQNIETLDQAFNWITKTPQEKSEKIALPIIRKIDADNNTKLLMEKAFINAAVGKFGALYVYIDKSGRLCQTEIPPQNLILDRRVDDDFGKGARFVAFIEFKTPDQIVTDYNFGDKDAEVKEELLKFSNNKGGVSETDFWAWATNTSGNFLWWDFQRQGFCKIACVHAFWISYEDGRYKRTDDGKLRKLNPNQKNKRGDYEVMTVRKCTLIGNRYVTDYGIEECVVYDPTNPGVPLLPVRYVVPNMHLGYNKSIVDRIKDYQKNIDALENKINYHISKDIGTGYVFNGNVAKGVNPADTMGDFKKWGLTVINRNDGEDLRLNEREQLIEKIDFNLTQNINQYINLYREKERLMEEITSTSKIALGQQQSYVGLNTQQNTIAQNTKGAEYIYSSLLKLYADVQGYSLEKFKLAFVYGKNTEIVKGVLNKNGMAFLKDIKDFTFHEMFVNVHLEDIIDEQMKSQLLQAAMMGLQGGLIEFKDFVAMIRFQTYSEMSAYMDEALARKERLTQQQQMMAEVMKQASIQAQGEQLKQLEAQKQQGQNQRAMLDAGVKGAKINADMLMNEQNNSNPEPQNLTQELPIRK